MCSEWRMELDEMNPTVANPAAGTRLLQLCTLLLVCLANPARSLCVLLLICVASPAGLEAQTTTDRESIRGVVDLLFLNADPDVTGDEVARHPGIWSVVIARFAKRDSREIEILAKVGEWYRVDGASESNGTDVDICIYGPEGDQIDCDTYEDNFPIVGFIAETDGVHRAVMTAASVKGGGTSFAGIVVFQVSDEEV